MGNLACDVLRATLYFLSANCAINIKSKSALKARTFLHVRMNVTKAMHVIGIGCLFFYSVRGIRGHSAGYLQRVQIKPFIVEIFTSKKHLIGVLQQLTWIFFVTDIKQTCLGQGVGVTIPNTARKRPSKLICSP